jgi:hypothetical protein
MRHTTFPAALCAVSFVALASSANAQEAPRVPGKDLAAASLLAGPLHALKLYFFCGDAE